MTTINPYQSPRDLESQPIRRSPLGLRRVFPKYGVERQLITIPLLFGLGLSVNDCGRGLCSDMYSYAPLTGGIVTYFNPPHWDEAAWTCAILFCVGFFATHFVLCVSGIYDRPSRTVTERWLANIAIVVGTLPLLLNCLMGHRPLRFIYDHGTAEVLAWAIGIYLFSALFQIWYWWNRRQAAMAVFYALLPCVAFGGWIAGQRLYRRPGRP